jgi:integrase
MKLPQCAHARPFEADEIELLMQVCKETRHKARNKLIVLLNAEAGLSVTEIAALKRLHLMTPGGDWDDHISVQGAAARRVPMSSRLLKAAQDVTRGVAGYIESPLIMPEREQDELRHMLPHSIEWRLKKLFKKAGLDGVTSRSGRRALLADVLANQDKPHISDEQISDLVGFKDPTTLARFKETVDVTLRHFGPEAVTRHTAVRQMLTKISPCSAPPPASTAATTPAPKAKVTQQFDFWGWKGEERKAS